ncbi:MAG: hypothetical protein ACKO9V_01435, partial [Candidatus Kapaibacterium sp.]
VASRQRFLHAMDRDDVRADTELLVEMRTQVARTFSLRGEYADAHALLDEVERALRETANRDMPRAHTRYLLERGRCLRSAGDAEASLPFFREAEEKATENMLWRLAIDAVHMLALAEATPGERIAGNLRGLAMVKEHPEEHGWTWALFNNLGEEYLATEEYPKAIETFSALAEYQKERNGAADIYTLKDLAKAHRLNGDAAYSLHAMRAIMDELEAQGTSNAWIREEWDAAAAAVQRGHDTSGHAL